MCIRRRVAGPGRTVWGWCGAPGAQRDERLWAAALRHLRPKALEHAEAGDILLFRMRDGAVAKHLGLAAEVGAQPSFIHAYSGHGVVESPLSAPWRRRLVARFQFPEEGS